MTRFLCAATKATQNNRNTNLFWPSPTTTWDRGPAQQERKIVRRKTTAIFPLIAGRQQRPRWPTTDVSDKRDHRRRRAIQRRDRDRIQGQTRAFGVFLAKWSHKEAEHERTTFHLPKTCKERVFSKKDTLVFSHWKQCTNHDRWHHGTNTF